jgi:Fe-Mn family superoxide dismutase
MMTRRQALKTTALATAAVATVPGVIAQPTPAAALAGPFTLPALPYAFDALEPHIDARTMEIHHDRHHKAYVDNLNKAVADAPELAKSSIEELLKNLNSVPEKNRTAVRNHGGGHYNHSLFWQMMKKDGGGEPKAELAKAIETSFGSFADFKTKFTEAATKVFGSGWAWLELGPDKKLYIESTPNQDSPILNSVATGAAAADAFAKRYGLNPQQVAKTANSEKIPLLGLDVWEHAYYLKYQNKRADYIAAWWNVVNWNFVAERYSKLKH